MTTTYSFTEKKRIRKDFGKRRTILEVPFLLAIQVDSYREFLQVKDAKGRDIAPKEREDKGLHAALNCNVAGSPPDVIPSHWKARCGSCPLHTRAPSFRPESNVRGGAPSCMHDAMQLKAPPRF